MIKQEPRGEVTVLTLDREEKRNALSVTIVRALVNAVCDAQRSSRAIVLTGAGSVFCAGADLSEDKVGGDFFGEFNTLIRTLRTSVPVIAYINGPAIGAGMMLTMACDIRVSADTARFSIPVGDMAIGVDEWVVHSLSSLVGESRARAMLLAGAPLQYSEAVSCGYVAAGSFDDAAELAERVASKAPLTMHNIKCEFAPDLYSAKQRAAALRAPFESEDIVEAQRAWAEKRRPNFKGR